MTKRKKRPEAAQDSAQQLIGKKKRIKTADTAKERQPGVVMSLECIQCNGNITDSAAGSKLSFFEDGNSLHLVMTMADEARVRTGFKVKSVPDYKVPNEKNPYASVSHVLCNNRKGGRTCNKKVGAVKCCPPFSDNQLIFFQHKALLSNGSRIYSWMSAREKGLDEVRLIPPSKEDEQRQFKPQERLPLVRCIAPATKGEKEASALGEGLTTSRPRPYEAEVFQSAVMGERNSLVYLPSGFGETLVAAMVMKRLMDVNTDRQAFFLVETDAEAMLQAGELQKELRCAVEVMIGSSLGFYTWDDCSSEGGGARNRCDRKLLDLRAARLVVATAGAFEHAMCKRYIDPDSICCVVLVLEEINLQHRYGRESSLHRLAKAFFLPMKDTSNASASSKPASQLPKIVAFTAAPSEENDPKEAMTVADTVLRLENLLQTFAADLAAPVRTLQEVKDRASRVELEVVNVASTPEETLLLQSLEKMVLRRVIKVAPNSDPALQAQKLLGSVVAATGVTTCCRDRHIEGDEMVRSIRESCWEFPSQAYAVLCQQALTVRARSDAETARTAESGGAGKGGGGDERGQLLPSSGDNREVVDEYHLTELMDLAFAVDETGDELSWRKLLRLLEEMWETTEEEMEEGEVDYDRGKGGTGDTAGKEAEVAETDDLDRDDAIHIIRSYLLTNDGGSDGDVEVFDKTSEAEAGAGGTGSGRVAGGEVGGALGSKLERIAKLLTEHKDWCDRSGDEFSAFVFVSTRELAVTTPETLESVPVLKPFLRPRYALGTPEWARAIAEGQANVLMSTPMYGEGLKVPDRGLVVCASGAAVVDLRGRLLYGENCRLVGLSRRWGEARRERVRTLCQRENTMWAAIDSLSGGIADSFAAAPCSTREVSTAKGATDTNQGQGSDGDGGGRIGITPVKIPHTTQAAQMAQSAAGSPRGEEADVAVAPEVLKPPPPLAATMIVPDKSPSEASNGNGNGKGVIGKRGAAEGSMAGAGAAPVDSGGGTKGWKKTLPDPPSAAARKYAATYLATCLKQTLQRKPDDLARCSINTTAQLAHAIKPVFEYDERRLPGSAHETVFEARCFVWSKVDELKGLIASKEAKGTSIKSSREAAAQKMMQYLLQKDEPLKAESLLPSSNASPSSSKKTDLA